MAYGEIRTVHAILSDGSQIVRYDRAKRWFHETADGRRIKRFRRVSDAARLVFEDRGTLFLGQPDGSYLDKYTRALYDGTPLEPIKRYTEAGLRQAIERAQRKYDREMESWKSSPVLGLTAHEVAYYQQYDWGRRYLLGLSRRPEPKKPDILKRKAS